MAKKALVIGSKGNIGKPLVRHLKSVGYSVVEVDIKQAFYDNYFMADINFPLDLLAAFDSKPDVVFLMASIVSRVTCEGSPSTSVSTNISGINNVMQLCKRYESRMVFLSTSEIYGNIDGEMSEDRTIPQPNNRYGLTKLLAEKLVEYEVKHNSLNAIILRPFMMYDESEELGDHRSAMIRFAENLSKGQEIVVHKNSSRGWFHVSDAVKAIEAAGSLSTFDIINIGSPEYVETIDLARMICKELGADPQLIKEEELPSKMTLSKKPALEKMKMILSLIPQVALQEGVKRVCRSIRERAST
jgi:nucleoside-diphosphate-sugar epimerase